MAIATNLDPATGADFTGASQRAGDEDKVRRAFRANLAAGIADRLGDRLHPDFLADLTETLTEVYADARHSVDLRTRIPTPGGGLYAVFQAGAFRKPKSSIGPLAARIFARTPGSALDQLSSHERDLLADCIERAEIAKSHPFDWRPRVGFWAVRIYLNLIGGEERRSRAVPIDDDRRADKDDTLAAAMLAVAVACLAGAGAWLIGPALVDAYLPAAEAGDAVGAAAAPLR